MCDIKTIVFLKSKCGGNSAILIDQYYDQIIDVTIKYFNMEYKGKLSSSTIVMYLSSLIGFNCDKCKFYINNEICISTDKISKYLKKNQKSLEFNCMINTNNNLNLNKMFKLFLGKKELNSDIRGKKIFSVNGCYTKFYSQNLITDTLSSNNMLEIHLSQIDETAKEYIRRKLSSHINIKVDNKTINFNYRWLSDCILGIQLLYIGTYEVNLKSIILDRETEVLLGVSNLETYIYEEFEMIE